LGLTFLALHLLAIVMLRYFTPFWVFNSVFMLGIFWYAGAFAAHLFLTGRGRVKGWWLVLAWSGFLALKATPHFTGLNLLKQAAWGLVCAIGILWAIGVEQRHQAFSKLRVVTGFRWLGSISYSLYAMHTPALMLATWTLLLTGVQSYTVQLVVAMLASIAATLAVYYGIERAFYRPRPDPDRQSGRHEANSSSPRSVVV
jgi:peptidoglycan/LPS O-acetylase OafA/YrhL